MPVLPRRRDEIGEPVEELKWREFDDAIGSRPRGLAAAAWPDPGDRLTPRHHVADASDAAVGVANHGEPLQRERRPGAIPQQVLEGLTKTYNRFHDPGEASAEIARLRELHAAMDRAVLDAYGWQDVQPVCGFALDWLDLDEDELADTLASAPDADSDSTAAPPAKTKRAKKASKRATKKSPPAPSRR